MCAKEYSTPALSLSFALPSDVFWRSLTSPSSRSSGWMLTLLPALLEFVQRSLRGHAALVFFGKRTTPPASKSISAPTGHLNTPRSQSSAKSVLGWRPAFLTAHALQYTSRSSERSRTSSLE